MVDWIGFDPAWFNSLVFPAPLYLQSSWCCLYLKFFVTFFSLPFGKLSLVWLTDCCPSLLWHCRCVILVIWPVKRSWNDLWCAEWDVKPYYTIPYRTVPSGVMQFCVFKGSDDPNCKVGLLLEHWIDFVWMLFLSRSVARSYNVSSGTLNPTTPTLSVTQTQASNYVSIICPQIITRGQSNLTKSASWGAHSPVRGHPRGSKVVPLNSWGRVSY